MVVVEPVLNTIEYIEFTYSTCRPTFIGEHPIHSSVVVPRNIAVAELRIELTVIVEEAGQKTF
jgi:hypothetical protein